MLDIAIIGAGPYGLSIAAHFRRRGISFRIFGRPMDSWLAHMPKGMMLKSDGFASNICDSDGASTLKHFCEEQGIEYSDLGLPVDLETFAAYGLAFTERMVPDLEDKFVHTLERLPVGFRLGLDSGETVFARRVVLAVGITHFEYVPAELAHLPVKYLSHSFHHHDLQCFKDRSVAVIGGGSSAIDLAGLLHEAGARVQLVARQASLKFHSKPTGKRSSWWQRIRYPQSGLGPGLRSRFFANAPLLFHRLPERFRLYAVRTHLGPSGGWFSRDKVIGRVPLLLGCTPQGAEIRDGMVLLHLRQTDGTTRTIGADHVVAATGYKVNLEGLTFLSTELRSELRAVEGSPVLSSTFESSVPDLYFVGIAAANSFGPVMRFAFGAGFAARRLTQTILKALAQNPASVPAAGVVTIAK